MKKDNIESTEQVYQPDEADAQHVQSVESDAGPTTILLSGPITDDTVAEVQNIIIAEQYEPNSHGKIRIFINTEGGELHAAFALVEVMQASRIPIETIAIGQCASAGLIIFMSGTKGMRTITPSCTTLTHNFSTDVGGNYANLMSTYKELRATNDRIVAHYVECTGLTPKAINAKLLSASDIWLSPADCVKYGIADQIGRVTF